MSDTTENNPTSPAMGIGAASRFSPGPWRHAPLSDDIIGPRGQGVCSPCDGYDEQQWPIDARLIAAAPEYYAATERLASDVTALDGDLAGCVAVSMDALDALLAAHLKAKGGR